MGEWVWPKGTRDASKPAVSGVLWMLHESGGFIESETGNCLSMLRDYLEDRGVPLPMPSAFTHVIGHLDGGRYGSCIERLTGPKRTYRIELLLSEDELPERPWSVAEVEPEPEVVPALEVAPEPEPEPEPVPASIEMTVTKHTYPADAALVGALSADAARAAEMRESNPTVAAEDVMSPIDKLLIISRMATEVLVDVAENLSHVPQSSAGDDAVLRRLSDTMDELERTRRKLRDAEETAVARTKEAEAVRRAKAMEMVEKDRTIRQLQENMAAITKGSKINDSGFRALDQMVRERPKVAAS